MNFQMKATLMEAFIDCETGKRTIFLEGWHEKRKIEVIVKNLGDLTGLIIGDEVAFTLVDNRILSLVENIKKPRATRKVKEVV